MPPLVRSLALGLLIATGSLPLLMSMANQPSLAQEASLMLQTPGHTLLSQADEQRLEADRLLQQGIQQYQMSQYSVAMASWQQALDIYRALNDRNGEADALTYLGIVYDFLGQYFHARDFHSQALAIYHELGDRNDEANALGNLGNVYGSLGQYIQARDNYYQVLTILQELGDRNGEAKTLNNLGLIYGSLGQYLQARDYHSQALVIYHELGDRNGEANAVMNLGVIYDSLGQYRQAMSNFSQALSIFQEIGDREGEANALGNLGNVYDSLGQYLQARENYYQVLTILQELGDRNGEAKTLNNLGLIYGALGQYLQARDYHSQALAIYQEIGDRNGEASAFNNLGIVYRSLGQYPQARDNYNQALSIFQDIGDRNGEANAMMSLGIVYHSLGQYREARDNYDQSLAIFQDIGDRNGEASAVMHLGLVYRSLGQYREAIEAHSQALIIFQDVGDRNSAASTLTGLGLVYDSLGQYPQARDNYSQALAIFQDIGDRKGEANALGNLGNVYLFQGQYSQAIDAHSQALAIFQDIGDLDGEMSTLSNLGNVYLFQGQYPQAIDAHSQALTFFHDIGIRDGEASTLNNLGTAYAFLGQYFQAKDYYSQALSIFRDIGDRNGEADALGNLGAAYQAQGKWSEAEAALQDAITAYKGLRPQTMDAQDQLSLLDKQTNTYQSLQAVLIAQSRPLDALEISESGRTRALITTLAAKLPLDVQAKLNLEAPTLVEMKQIAAAQNATLVEYSIISNPDTTDGAADELILIWVVKPNRTIISASTSLPNHETLTALTDIFPQLSGTGEGAKDTTPDIAKIDQTLEQLYTLLIAPIAAQLPNKALDPANEFERVIFIPHEELFRVPFAALKNSETDQYLIETHTILTAPSIQALSLTREHRDRVRLSNHSGALVVGDPAIAPDLMTTMAWEPLRGTATEANAIATRLDTTALLQETATEAIIRHLMPQARYIHLATHGALTPNAVTIEASAAETAANRADTDRLILERATYNQVPGFVALTPTPGSEAIPGLDNPDDGILSANEIITMTIDNPLTAELVVLSACQTGTGPVTSDGVYGLSYAFITAGVPSLVVSLWNANDSGVTDQLMEDFYTNLTSGEHQGDKAQSLRQAMLQQLEDGNLNPAGWAAFTLIGEAK